MIKGPQGPQGTQGTPLPWDVMASIIGLAISTFVLLYVCWLPWITNVPMLLWGPR